MVARRWAVSFAIVSSMILASGARAQPPPPEPAGTYLDTDPSALTDFAGALAPYGRWRNDPTYGTVWIPHRRLVGNDFAPYVTGGRWTYDETGGYVWVSDYAWGWVPFHYGRWVFIARIGWAWIPGRTYAGAWVSWRTGDGYFDYIGWAPLPPTWIWRDGRPVGLHFVPRQPYVYIPHRHLFARDVSGHAWRGRDADLLGRRTQEFLRRPGGAMGPPPNSFGRQRVPILRPPRGDRGLDRARELARPVRPYPGDRHR